MVTARRLLPGLTEQRINPSSAERARVKSKQLKKLERAGRIPGPACARARSGREGLTALLHPKLVQQVDIRLTPLVVGGPEFFPDVLLELLGAGASLDFLQLDLMLKIDVAKRPRDLFHHQVKAGRVHPGLLVGVIGHVSLHDCSSLFGATLIQEVYGVSGQYRCCGAKRNSVFLRRDGMMPS
jgi:hypothetical protein